MTFDSAANTPRVVTSRALPAPRFRYSPVVQAGPFVFVSGMVALDNESGGLVPGDAYVQTLQIFNNLGRLLEEQNWSLKQMALARIFFTGENTFSDINRAWEQVFSDDSPPARTSAGVSVLPLEALVEIEFQFYIDSPTFNGG